MKMRHLILPAFCVGIMATACSSTDIEETTPEPLSTTGLALTMDYFGESDVKGFRFIVKKCGTDEVVKDKTRYLEDLTLPGMIPEFVNNPFDKNSKHLFADHFMVLDKGCYDVKVIPIAHDKTPSQDCQKASAQDVYVHKGLTTEILLVSQCKGPKRGGLDVIGALNHPPVIKKLTFDPSKFLYCPKEGNPEVILCATAQDPDNDPLEFVWEQIGGPDVVEGPIPVSTTKRYGKVTDCVKFIFDRKSDQYAFRVTVYDLFHKEGSTKYDPKLIRAEDWYKKNGYGEIKSRASLEFPVYVSCKKKKQPEPDAGFDVGGGDVEDDVDDGDLCPRTQGYWGTHYDRDGAGGPLDIPWPDLTMDQVGRTEDMLFCENYEDPLGLTWVEIMQISPEGGSMWVNLAHQYIAARLNIAAGAASVEGLTAALIRADEILRMCDLLTPPPTELRHEAEALATFLDQYNNGHLLYFCPDQPSVLNLASFAE